MNDISFAVSKGDGRKCGIIYGTIKRFIFGKERLKMEDWLINYYEQTDPLKRQQMLLENKNETISEEDKLRMKLWETRYGKGKPRKVMFGWLIL